MDTAFVLLFIYSFVFPRVLASTSTKSASDTKLLPAVIVLAIVLALLALTWSVMLWYLWNLRNRFKKMRVEEKEKKIVENNNLLPISKAPVDHSQHVMDVKNLVSPLAVLADRQNAKSNSYLPLTMNGHHLHTREPTSWSTQFSIDIPFSKESTFTEKEANKNSKTTKHESQFPLLHPTNLNTNFNDLPNQTNKTSLKKRKSRVYPVDGHKMPSDTSESPTNEIPNSAL